MKSRIRVRIKGEWGLYLPALLFILVADTIGQIKIPVWKGAFIIFPIFCALFPGYFDRAQYSEDSGQQKGRGGRMVHGLFPGPELFTTKASIICSVMAGFIPANIMLHIAGMLISRYVVHVPRISSAIMCAVIVGSSVIGPYAIDEGMVPVTEPITRVRVCNTNTNAVLLRRQSHA